jgi:acid phosphatase family membrane protein YuiD
LYSKTSIACKKFHGRSVIRVSYFALILSVIALWIRDTIRELWQCCTGVPSGHSAPVTKHSVTRDTRDGLSRSHKLPVP